MKKLIKNINGNIFHISALNFQGDNKKFYLTYHPSSELNEFDLVINRSWINSSGINSVTESLKTVFYNPEQAITVRTLGSLRKIYIKLDYYRKRQSEKEIESFRECIKDELKKIENAEITLIEKFRSLNESGQAMVMSYIEDLTGMNRYKLEV